MTHSIRSISIVTLALLLSLAFVSVARAESDKAPLRARVATTTKAEIKDRALDNRLDMAKDRGVREIERRDKALDNLLERVGDMVRLSDSEKARITALLQAQIDSLMSLKVRVESASDLGTLKTDIKTIKDSYRVFSLTIPQTRITVAAEKMKTTAISMTELSVRLERAIAEATSQGKDTVSLSRTLADMKTQIASATTHANEALRLVGSLTPDNGDTAKVEANMKALREAQAAIKAGHEDLKQARKDAAEIVKGLREFGIRADLKPTTPTP